MTIKQAITKSKTRKLWVRGALEDGCYVSVDVTRKQVSDLMATGQFVIHYYVDNDYLGIQSKDHSTNTDMVLS